MTWSDFVSIGAFLISIIIGIGTWKKNKADTFVSYQKSLGDAQKNYANLNSDFQKMCEEFSQLKEMYNKLESQYKHLDKNYKALATHNKALIKQLVSNRITPITLEQAKEYSTEEC